MAETKQPAWCWLDLEMTGLDPALDRILEAALIVTSPDFSTTITEWVTAIFQSPETLAGMNDWCQQTHRESGLLDRVPDGISEATLDTRLVESVEGIWQGTPVILCGNSIGQDRKFVDRYLPRFATLLHYRMLDVSSFKVLFQELHGKQFAKQNTHRALDDIRESMAELRYYLAAIDPAKLPA